jgi:CHAT domain-containing protein/tetratricopeptide (TPR) repeat protein
MPLAPCPCRSRAVLWEEIAKHDDSGSKSGSRSASRGWRVVGLALLVPLALAGGACGAAAPAGDVEGGSVMAPAPVDDPVRLAIGEVVAGDLGRPQPHRYEVEVPAGHYLRVVGRQLGADVTLRLVPPDGGPAIELDTPSGRGGEETAHAVAESGGVYLVEVEVADDVEPGGRYEILVADLRPATAEDRLRSEAETALAIAEGLRRRRQPGRGEAYAEALAATERLGDARMKAYVVDRLGQVAQDELRPAEALAAFESSLALYAGLGDEKAQARLHNRIASIDRDAGRLDRALEHQRQALALYRSIGDEPKVAATLASYGQMLEWAGRPLEALSHLHEALDIRRRLGDRAGEIDPHLRLGEVHLSLQQLAEAADSFDEAARLARELADRQAEAIAEHGLATQLNRSGRSAEAVDHLVRALELARAEDDERLQAVILGDLGTAELQRGRIEAARAALTESLAIARRLGDLRNEAFALHKLARCHYDAGEYGQSAKLHGEAADRFGRFGDPAAAAGARYGQARSLRRLGDLAPALELLEAALAAADELRRATGGHELQTSLAASKQHYRELHVDLLMELDARHPGAGHDRAALSADDRGRTRALLDLLQIAAEDAAAIPPELIAERRSLEARLASLRRFGQSLIESGSTEEAVAGVERQQRALLTRLDRVRAEAQRAAPRVDEASDPAAWSGERLDALLDADTLLDDDTLVLVYSLGEERSFLWALWRGGRWTFVLPPRAEIELAAGRTAAALASPAGSAREEGERSAAELARLVLAPVGDRLRRHRRIAVVADGELLHVPFAALADPAIPGVPLVATHELVALPSLSVLERLRRRPAPVRWRGLAAVVADPVFEAADPRLAGGAAAASGRAVAGAEIVTRALGDLGLRRFARLPGTRAEAEALLSLLPEGAEVYRAFDFAADREAVLGGALAGYRIVHLATHGVLDRRTPSLSGLVFSLVDEAGRPRDGYLPLHEVYGLDLNAEVIVLSACQSGTGKEMNGEGLVGLTRGFMEAGAPRLVVSLWQVGDRGSAELMQRFYRAWLVDGETPAAALAGAQRSMWRDAEWSAPYHWAGFQLVGDWTGSRPLSLEADDSTEAEDDGTTRRAGQDDDLPGPGDDDEPPAP